MLLLIIVIMPFYLRGERLLKRVSLKPLRIIIWIFFTGQITGYAHSPVLIEEGYKGFNIVHYRMKYYALLQSLGSIDLTHSNGNELQKYTDEHKCVVGSSGEEVRQLVDKIVLPGSDSSDPLVEMPLEISPVKKKNRVGEIS